MGLAVGMALKFYTSVAKRLKIKARKFLGLIYTFVEVTGGKLVRALSRPFCSKMRMLSGFMKKDETIYSRRRKLIIHQYNLKKPEKYEILYRSLSENKVPNI